MNKKQKRERAEKWFAAHGINPNTPDSDGNQRVLDMRPTQSFTEDMDGVISHPCTITVEGFLFYAHVTVEFNDGTNSYEFQGGSGGVGVGDLTCEGVIYYGIGGVCQVTWGTSGNASAAGIGEGLGAFGGSGSW